MDYEFAEILKKLVSTYGIDILKDVNKCEHLLSEHSDKYKRDIELFIEILKSNVQTKPLPAKKENTVLAIGVLAAFLSVALIFTFILSSLSNPVEEHNPFSGIANNKPEEKAIEYIPFIDNRDNKEYKTIVIGSLIWFAENLNYKTGNSWCYENDEYNCKKYGRLYDWNTARVACPNGWHLPSRAEWDDMIYTVGDNSVGKKLKSKNGWNKISRIGTDEYGFGALPGGRRFANGNFRLIGEAGNWWTSTECSHLEAYYRYMNASINEVGESNYYRKIMGFSVRCVKN
ncbi:MAG: fibrobacter succinogenes major paralogous domain-containing protein [Fibromonadales bacterium]|nr:fibrobacter succinogenes major paralogous domain-containing protein [Fibromonadales bacterium]